MGIFNWLALVVLSPKDYILFSLTQYSWQSRKTQQLIRQFFEATGVSQEDDWVEDFLLIKNRADNIIWKLHTAIRAKSPRRELDALSMTVDKLPKLIQELNDLTLPNNDKSRQSITYYVSSLSTYLLACQCFLKGLEENNDEAIKEGVRQVNIACDLMDKSFELSGDLNKQPA